MVFQFNRTRHSQRARSINTSVATVFASMPARVATDARIAWICPMNKTAVRLLFQIRTL